MPIQKNTNEETDLIIGNRFPVDNEETFAGDAVNQRMVATNLRQLREQIAETKKIISETMTGQTATSYLESLEAQEKKFQEAADSHDMIAEGLETTANNIAVTKANMNHADDMFHENMGNLKQWGVSTGQVQETMSDERTKLLDEAQENIRRSETELSSFQQEAVSNLNAGNPVGSNTAFRLNEGATSSAIIDSKGAGFTGASTSGTASVGGVLGTGSGAGRNQSTTQKRFNSSDSSTSLSSTTLADRPTSVSSGGFVVPSTITSQTQNNPSTSAAPGGATMMPPGMLGSLGSSLSGQSGVVSSAPAGSTTQNRTGNMSPASSQASTRPETDGRISPEWSDGKNEIVTVAATLWQNLAAMGWETPVAVARVRYENNEQDLVWTTNFGASFVPDTVTTSKAKPIDLSKVSEKIAQRITLLPASVGLDLWLQHTGIEVSDRVVIAPRQDHIAKGFDRVDYTELFQLDEQRLLQEVVLSSDEFAPVKYDNPIARATELASQVDHSLGEALQYAMYAQVSGGTENMPDGTSLSAAGYLKEAVCATLKLKLDSGDKDGYHFLIWQAEQFDNIA